MFPNFKLHWFPAKSRIEVMFSDGFACLCVLATLWKKLHTNSYKTVLPEVCPLNFGGDPDQDPDPDPRVFKPVNTCPKIRKAPVKCIPKQKIQLDVLEPLQYMQKPGLSEILP
ncbi:hypothetical protein GOODEAATRI_014199 [Goodea atripinnis]|uniref:Uncharacterized protein n=1 Tax=Goodea atripinnis TaxID=208336 RepID=A0ABV0MHN6_9TELE